MNRNITALILIVVAAGLYFTVTRGMLDKALAVKETNDRYTAALNDAARLVDVRDQVLAEYNSIPIEDRERLDKLIPSSVDNIRLIVDLNNIAQRHGFSLFNIETEVSPVIALDGSAPLISGEAVSVPTLDTVKVSFSANAPYNQFVSFLQDLESSLRVMDVTRLSVLADDGSIYEFEVELQTYWVRQ